MIAITRQILKVNVIAGLEFELTKYDVAVQHAMETPSYFNI